MPRCAPTIWDHEQDSQAAFFAACDHPPEVAEKVAREAAMREKERKREQRRMDLSKPPNIYIMNANTMHTK